MESHIKDAVAAALHELGLPAVDFVVEHPGDLAHGDYAVNVALVLSKQVGRAPRELAEEIALKLEGRIEDVSKISVEGPGFINVHLAREFFSNQIAKIVSGGESWGSDSSLAGEEIMVEYTSPNLFKPLHIGNLVGNIVGESLARLFQSAGATVHRLNYPSDIGLTVAKGVWGLTKTGGDPSDIHELGKAYIIGNDAYEAAGEEKAEIEAVNRALYAGDNPELNNLRERGIATSRARLAELCAILGTTFDTDIPESEASPVGTEVVKAELANGIFEESDGAVVYRGEKVGLHTRVFLNSQGLPTYEAKDLGNFVLKQKAYPSWTQSFVVTGGEQAEYFKVIIAAIREIFVDASHKVMEHVPTGFLTLTTGKMSSRKGNVLTGESLLADMEERAAERAAETRTDNLEELTKQIAVAALKYQILRQKVGMNIVFDKEQALSFEGDSGPYLQYTTARIQSVLEKAEAAGVVASHTHAPALPYELERVLYRFPNVVARAREERSPHYLVVFMVELAGTFNSFYAHEKIADSSDEYAPYKAALAGAVGQTLKNGLWLLGIKAPLRM